MAEIVKRLAPKKETLRELYLKSGNQCAFPGCNRIMIDDQGVFVGQVCHIEAAEKGGERFNPDQSNEFRRTFSNLMLMCYDHHQVTDDVDEYPVARLKEMKGEHERKYGDIAQTLRNSIVDYTEGSEVGYAKNLRRIGDLLNWNLSELELRDNLPELNEFCDTVKKLPVPTRELLVVIINRAEHLSEHRYSTMRYSLGISVSELGHACALDDQALVGHLHILVRYGLIMEGDPYDFNGLPAIHLIKLKSGWDIWHDLKQFKESEGGELSEFFVQLDFTLLDS